MKGRGILDPLLSLTLFLAISTCLATSIRVVRVIDGDTFETETGEKVRMIGINAPEASDVNGGEATRHLAELIEGKDVALVLDAMSKDRDRYQRLLRYVEVSDTDVNLQMIRDGYAFAYLKYRFTRAEAYQSAQVLAAEQRVGMWGDEVQKGTIPNVEHNGTSLSLKAWLVLGLVVILLLIVAWNAIRRV